MTVKPSPATEIMRARDAVDAVLNLAPVHTEKNQGDERSAYIASSWADARRHLDGTAAGVVAGVRPRHLAVLHWLTFTGVAAVIAIGMAAIGASTWAAILIGVVIGVGCASLATRIWTLWRFRSAARRVATGPDTGQVELTETAAAGEARRRIGIAKSRVLSQPTVAGLAIPGTLLYPRKVTTAMNAAWEQTACAVYVLEDENTPPVHRVIENGDSTMLPAGLRILDAARRLSPVKAVVNRTGSSHDHAIAAALVHQAVASVTITTKALGTDPRLPATATLWRYLVPAGVTATTVAIGITVLHTVQPTWLVTAGIVVAAQLIHALGFVCQKRIPQVAGFEDRVMRDLSGHAGATESVAVLCKRELRARADDLDAVADEISGRREHRSEKWRNHAAVNLNAAAVRLRAAGEILPTSSALDAE